jgi:hypothetical protein
VPWEKERTRVATVGRAGRSRSGIDRSDGNVPPAARYHWPGLSDQLRTELAPRQPAALPGRKMLTPTIRVRNLR